MSKKKIVLDTNVLGWALRDKLKESDRPKKIKAEKYFKHLSDNNVSIVLPAVVLFELLSVYSDTDSDQRDKIQFMDTLSRHCQVTDFDDESAVVAAEYFSLTHSGACRDDSAEREKSKRKTDTMILAQAACEKADELITNDRGFIKLAGKLYEARKCTVTVTDIPEDPQIDIEELM